jgi:hypothetical protein
VHPERHSVERTGLAGGARNDVALLVPVLGLILGIVLLIIQRGPPGI